ncbi:hypothetical protein [Natronococcus sp.]|uniref:hypothetical protein n=1 Tax=Natronococcus sp. TaxID=35747 RepID=UPI0025DAD5DD|nr:hypothetical protein [Natronococcus sp.]
MTHRWITDRKLQTAVLGLAGDSYEVTVKIASDDGDRYDVRSPGNNEKESAKKSNPSLAASR